MDLLIRLHKLSSRERVLVLMILVSGIALMGYLIFMKPQITKSKMIRRSLVNAQQTLKMRQNQVRKASLLKRSRQNLQQIFDSVHERMFSTTELHPLLKELARDVEQSNCDLRSILPRTGSTSDQAGSVLTVETIEIRLQGSYRAIMEVMRRIEQRSQFISIDEIVIDATADSQQLQALLTLHVYSFNEEPRKSTG